MFQHIYLFISRCSSLTRTINPEYSVCFLKEKPSLLRVGSLERLPRQPAFCPQKLKPETYSSKTLSIKEWKLSCPQLPRKCQLVSFMALFYLFLPFLFWLHKRKPERTEDVPIPSAASGGRSRCLPEHCPVSVLWDRGVCVCTASPAFLHTCAELAKMQPRAGWPWPAAGPLPARLSLASQQDREKARWRCWPG